MKNREARKAIKQDLAKTENYLKQGLKDWWSTDEAQDRRIIALTLWEILETLDAIERKL